MAQIATTSRPGRIPVSDGRSAEAQYAKRVRNELIAHVGGNPSAPQRLLIDSIASISLRVRAMDCDPLSGHSNREYLDATATLGQLLAQLGVQPAAPASSIMPLPPQHEAAA